MVHREVIAMRKKKNKTSDAQLMANRKYDEKFETLSCRFKPGTKNRVAALGYSMNKFVNMAIEKMLEEEEKKGETK